MTLTAGPQTSNGRPPSPWRRRRAVAAQWARWGAEQARIHARRARGWAPGLIPGLAAVGLISAALGSRFGVWAGLLAAGIACLAVDRRMR